MGACEVPSGVYLVFVKKETVEEFFDEVESLFAEKLGKGMEKKTPNVLRKYLSNVDEKTFKRLVNNVINDIIDSFIERIDRNYKEGYHTYLKYVDGHEPLIIYYEDSKDYIEEAVEEGCQTALEYVESEEDGIKLEEELVSELRNVVEKTYPTLDELKKMAKKFEDYLGVVEIECHLGGLWNYKIIEDYGISLCYKGDPICETMFSN